MKYSLKKRVNLFGMWRFLLGQAQSKISEEIILPDYEPFFIYYVNTSHHVGLYFHEYDNNSPLGLQSVDSTRLCFDRGKVVDNDNNCKLSMSWPRFVCEREFESSRERKKKELYCGDVSNSE